MPEVLERTCAMGAHQHLTDFIEDVMLEKTLACVQKNTMDTKKVKVAIVINDLTVGGAQRLIVDQLKHADPHRFEYSLITLFAFPGRPHFYDALPPHLSLYRLNFRHARDLENWLALWRTLRTIRADVVISHLFFSNTLVRVLKVLCGYTCIAVEQNTYTHKTQFQIFVDRILSHLTFRVVAISKTVAAFTSQQEHIPLGKFRVIYNAVDVRNIDRRLSALPPRNAVKTALGFREEDKLIISVGRLTPQKNQQLLIEAFACFAADHPEYRLVIVGHGPERKKLEHTAEQRGVSEKVHLPGYQDPVPYYAAAEFFILTSTIEGFAIVGIEAMACGLPVVSTKTAGPNEYIRAGENGFFIESDSVDAVVQSMEKVLTADGDHLRTCAQETARRFDIRETARQYEELFLEAVS